MREVTFQQLSDAVRELCIQANTILPQDLRVAICKAMETEQSGVGRAILGDLRENYEFAQAKGLPICQDTGMAVVFVDWGQDCHLTGGSLEDAVNDGVARGYVDGHLRLSVVADPLRRGNTNNNTPAILHLRMVPWGPGRPSPWPPKALAARTCPVYGCSTPLSPRNRWRITSWTVWPGQAPTPALR